LCVESKAVVKPCADSLKYSQDENNTRPDCHPPRLRGRQWRWEERREREREMWAEEREVRGEKDREPLLQCFLFSSIVMSLPSRSARIHRNCKKAVLNTGDGRVTRKEKREEIEKKKYRDSSLLYLVLRGEIGDNLPDGLEHYGHGCAPTECSRQQRKKQTTNEGKIEHTWIHVHLVPTTCT
jgi:hypothetical protein